MHVRLSRRIVSTGAEGRGEVSILLNQPLKNRYIYIDLSAIPNTTENMSFVKWCDEEARIQYDVRHTHCVSSNGQIIFLTRWEDIYSRQDFIDSSIAEIERKGPTWAQ